MPSPPQRLRERKLVQWGLAYLAGAWILLEAFGFVADRFGWPSMLVRAATILLALGFLLTLVLAWYHGEKGRQRMSPVEVILIAGLVVTGGALLRIFAPDGRARAGTYELSAAVSTRFLVLLPDGETLKGTESALAISPDGSRLAYVAGRGDSTRLYARDLASFEARPIPGTEGARAPFFSPDGEWLGFFADRAVKKVALRGGTPQTIVRGAWTARWEWILSGSWGPDDMLLLSYPGSGLGSALWQVPASGGVASPVGPQDWSENVHTPQLLPDGKHILATVSGMDGGSNRIVVIPVGSGEPRVLVDPGADGRYVATGHLVYQLDGDLLAAAFDPETLEVTGPAVPVVEDVLENEYGSGQFAVSPGGTLAYVPAGVERIERSLVWVDSAGAIEPVAGSRDDAYTPRISPAGDAVAFQRRPEYDLWLMDLERGTQRPVSAIPDTLGVFWHVWTPDGSGLVFNADVQGTGWLNLYEARVGSRSPLRPITLAEAHQQPQDWTPDGETLVYTEWVDSATQVDIWIVPVPADWTAETDRSPRPYLRTPASEFHPALSPDGRWMAYVSDRSGQWEVYVAPFPDAAPVEQVSTGGGSEPSWSPDGRTLYYRSLGARNMARQMLAVSVREGGPGAALRLDRPRVLFDGPYFQCSEWGRSYDLAPDGDRFLMVYDQRPDLQATQINVVVNWLAELRDL